VNVSTTTRTDQFNRANGAPGAPWTQLGTVTLPSIVSNQLQGQGISYQVPATGPDVDFTVLIVNFPGSVFRPQIGGSADLYSDTPFGGYIVTFISGTLTLQRKVSGATATTVGTLSPSGGMSSGQTFRWLRVGGQHTFYRDGVSLGSLTDASPLPDKGFVSLNSNNGATVWDNFTVTYEDAPTFSGVSNGQTVQDAMIIAWRAVVGAGSNKMTYNDLAFRVKQAVGPVRPPGLTINDIIYQTLKTNLGITTEKVSLGDLLYRYFAQSGPFPHMTIHDGWAYNYEAGGWAQA
jgi:hypothetical protein